MEIYIICFRKIIFASACIWCVCTTADAQNFEIGFFAGKSNYVGELQYDYYDSRQAELAFGGFATYNFNNWLGIKNEFISSKISGNDANFIDIDFKNRNLSFESNITEISSKLKISLANFGKDPKKPIAKTYIFGGVGLLKFNPTTLLNGERVELQPLGTEGQNLDPDLEPYDLTELIIPFGMGFQINVTSRLSFSGELKFRYVKTDYLDDVSAFYPDIDELQSVDPLAARLSFRTPEIVSNYDMVPTGEIRGDERKYDTYYFFGGNISYKIFKKRTVRKIPTFFDQPIK